MLHEVGQRLFLDMCFIKNESPPVLGALLKRAPPGVTESLCQLLVPGELQEPWRPKALRREDTAPLGLWELQVSSEQHLLGTGGWQGTLR